MDMKSSHLDGVAGQALVDPVFHVAAQRLVREPSQSIGQDNEQGEQPQQPQPTPAYRQRHGRLLSLDTQTSYLRAWRVPGDRNLKEALVASALPERTGSGDETPRSYVTRKEFHFLGNLFIGHVHRGTPPLPEFTRIRIGAGPCSHRDRRAGSMLAGR